MYNITCEIFRVPHPFCHTTPTCTIHIACALTVTLASYSTSRLSAMPPKEKKRKKDSRPSSLDVLDMHLRVPTNSSELPSTSVAVSAPFTPSTVSRWSLDSWRLFAQAKYLQKHPWLVKFFVSTAQLISRS